MHCFVIAKIFVYKHCFCYLNVENVKQKNPLFYQPIVLWWRHWYLCYRKGSKINTNENIVILVCTDAGTLRTPEPFCPKTRASPVPDCSVRFPKIVRYWNFQGPVRKRTESPSSTNTEHRISNCIVFVSLGISPFCMNSAAFGLAVFPVRLKRYL